MLREIQQVLRFVVLLGKQRRQPVFKSAGGLLVLLWTETGDSEQSLNCTVAAAGLWCRGIQMKALQPVLTDLKESVFPCAWPCSHPDPEELSTFTDLYGSLRLLLSFQMKDARPLSLEMCAHIEAFLHTFSLINSGIQIHFKFKFNQQSFHREFSVKIRSKVALANQPSLTLDVTCRTQLPECVKTGCWCHGGHPVVGGRLPLSIPPEAMGQGLFGELSIQPVTLLSPCVLQYPNLPTQLTHIQLNVKGPGMRVSTSKSDAIVLPLDRDCSNPSNVPVTGPSAFFQKLAAHVDCQELGLHSLRCSPCKRRQQPLMGTTHADDLLHRSGTMLTVERENCEESSPPRIQQSILLFLFLQHSDPFTCQLSDIMATEALIEHHLEDILNNNKQAVTTALQTELKNALEAHNRRKKGQETLRSAAEVILSSSIDIVSCSSNMDFRNACLNSMKVHDTHGLSTSLRESLRRLTSWKFIPRSRCYSAQMGEHDETDEPLRTEI